MNGDDEDRKQARFRGPPWWLVLGCTAPPALLATFLLLTWVVMPPEVKTAADARSRGSIVWAAAPGVSPPADFWCVRFPARGVAPLLDEDGFPIGAVRRAVFVSEAQRSGTLVKDEIEGQIGQILGSDFVWDEPDDVVRRREIDLLTDELVSFRGSGTRLLVRREAGPPVRFVVAIFQRRVWNVYTYEIDPRSGEPRPLDQRATTLWQWDRMFP